MMNLDTCLLLSYDHNELECISSTFYPQQQSAAPKFSNTSVSQLFFYTPAAGAWFILSQSATQLEHTYI